MSPMISKCANPDCSAPFEFRTGRLVIVRQPNAEASKNTHSVRHFWLCRSCSKSFKLEEHEAKLNLVSIQTPRPHSGMRETPEAATK